MVGSVRESLITVALGDCFFFLPTRPKPPQFQWDLARTWHLWLLGLLLCKININSRVDSKDDLSGRRLYGDITAWVFFLSGSIAWRPVSVLRNLHA